MRYICNTRFSFNTGVLLFTFFFIGCIPQYGQDYVNILRMYGQFAPDTEYDDEQGKTDLKKFGTRLLLPIPLKNDRVLLPGLYLEKIEGKLSADHMESTTVYTINPQIGIQLKHSESWKGNYLLLPSLYSDLKEIGSNDFQLGLITTFTKTKSDRFNYLFGMYLNTEVYGLNFLPLAGLYYINEQKTWEIDALMPVFLDINYRISEKLRFGLHYLAIGTTHHLNKYGADESGYYLEKGSKDVFAYVEVPVMKDWAFQAMVGHSFGRYYDVYDRDDKLDGSIGPIFFGDDRKQVNGNISDGLVMKFRLIYRYPLTK
mgnify:CR=1 FL=1